MKIPFNSRLLSNALKIIAAAAIASLAVYRIRYSPVEVQAFKASNGTVVAEVMGTGTLEAKKGAAISPKISGLIVNVLADQNDRVAKDQLLVELDDGDLLQQVEMAKADIASLKANIERSDADISRAEASAVKARADYKRALTLRQSNVVAQNEMDKASEEKDVAEANLRHASLSKTEAEKELARAESALKFQTARLKDTKILSPFDALVIKRNRDPGDVAVPGTSIMDIVSTELLWVSAWVDESAIGTIALGQPAKIVFRSMPGTPFDGKVARIAPEVDRETREFIVDVAIARLPVKWAVGQRAEVYIETGRSDDTVLVPSRFVQWRDGKPFLMVDESGKARSRQISLGIRGRENVEIKEGLKAGETVIAPLPGGQAPRDGRSIRHAKP